MLKQKLLAEFIGTFFLVTVVAFSGNPVAIGAVLMVLVYSYGHISGGHFNPAVTFAFYLKKLLQLNEMLAYWAVQFGGAFVAALIYLLITGNKFSPEPAAGVTILTAFLIETIFTFLLVRTILKVTAEASIKNNSYFGLAIGGALLVGAIAGGPLSGGVYNPAVGIAPLLLNMNALLTNPSLILLYILGPIAGATLAVKLNIEK